MGLVLRKKVFVVGPDTAGTSEIPSCASLSAYLKQTVIVVETALSAQFASVGLTTIPTIPSSVKAVVA